MVSHIRPNQTETITNTPITKYLSHGQAPKGAHTPPNAKTIYYTYYISDTTVHEPMSYVLTAGLGSETLCRTLRTNNKLHTTISAIREPYPYELTSYDK